MNIKARRMPLLATVVGVTLGLTMLGVPGAQAVGDPVPTPAFHFEGVKYAGSGCPADSVNVAVDKEIDPGTSHIVLAFDQYVASAGPDVPIIESRQNCLVEFEIHHPEGYQHAVFSSGFRGFIELDKQVTAGEKVDVSHGGSEAVTSFHSNWLGPIQEDYEFNDDIASSAYVWSPCGKSVSLNVDARKRVSNADDKNGSGALRTDTIVGKATTLLGLKWRKCQQEQRW